MTGMNFFSHGSQDLYPTYLTKTKGLNKHNESVAVIISNCGAVAGGLFGGYISQIIGRRWTIIGLALWTAAWIPLWIIPDSFGGLAAGGFFVQSGVQGAWGVIVSRVKSPLIPAHLPLRGVAAGVPRVVCRPRVPARQHGQLGRRADRG
jgi:MFS family permease